MRVTFWTGLGVFLVDQLSKYVVVHLLDLQTRQSLDVLPPFFNLRMAWNDGINFGLLGGGATVMRWVLIAVALLISGMVLNWVRREGGGKAAQISAGLLVGGALGNVLDRLIYGAVADFLNMACCGIDNPYAFNVADISIFLGAVGLVIFTGKDRPSPRKKTP